MGGYVAKVRLRGLCLKGLVGNHVLIHARVTDIATVFKSLLDSSIPRQFLDMKGFGRIRTDAKVKKKGFGRIRGC